MAADTKDINAFVAAQEARGSVDELVDEYVHLTLVGGGNPSPNADDMWHAKEGIGKLFRSQLESGDSDTIMRALNGLADLRRQQRQRDKQVPQSGRAGGERDIHHAGNESGTLTAGAADGGATGSSDVSPDKPTRADHGRSQVVSDPQRDIQGKQKEPAHPMADDKHPHGDKKHK